MKILYLCPDLGIPVLGRKGAAVHVRELAGAFARAGHNVIVAAQMLNKSPWEKPAEVPFTVLQVRPNSAGLHAVGALKQFNELMGIQNSLPGELRRILYNQDLADDLTRRFENDPPDFIYERASLYATGGVLLARALKKPLLLELNAPLAAEQSAYRATGFGELAAQAERWTLSGADAVLAVSALLKEHVAQLGVPPERVHVLPNGMNPEHFYPGPPDPELRHRLKLNNSPVIGFVGGLRPWHGIEMLPDLLERLTARNKNVRLLIAGDGPLRKQLEVEIARRGLDSNVVITGLVPHEQIPALIRQFDIALAPYPEAGHAFYFSPLKLFEYMACGVPVVAPRLGQISEIVRDGENGLLHPAGDLDALSSLCERLLTDGSLREKLKQTAARETREKYTWDHNVARIMRIYRQLTSGGAPSQEPPEPREIDVGATDSLRA